MRQTVKEFSLLKAEPGRQQRALAEALSDHLSESLTLHEHPCCDVVRNIVSGPVNGTAGNTFTCVLELTRKDQPADRDVRYTVNLDGIDRQSSISFLAHEHIIREGGGPAKFMSLLRRQPGMTFEEFSDYWRKGHADLVRSIPKVWDEFSGYRQNHILPGTCLHLDGKPVAQPYDGIVEIWFDSFQALESTMMSQYYRDVIRPDEETFVDLPNTRMIVEESVISTP